MDKALLIAMYEMKDPKRRRKLYEFFQELFAQNLSAVLTVEIINKELGSKQVEMSIKTLAHRSKET